MLFQEKKKCYCYFAGSVLFGRAIRAQDVQIRTTSGRANASSRLALSFILSFSLLRPVTRLSRSPLHHGDHVSHVDDRLRGARTRACFVRERVRARVRMRHERAVAADATDPMHFNIGSFNDLHNEAICFLSSRMRPRGLSRNRIRKYMYTCRDGIRDINRPHNVCNTLDAQLHLEAAALFPHGDYIIVARAKIKRRIDFIFFHVLIFPRRPRKNPPRRIFTIFPGSVLTLKESSRTNIISFITPSY